MEPNIDLGVRPPSRAASIRHPGLVITTRRRNDVLTAINLANLIILEFRLIIYPQLPNALAAENLGIPQRPLEPVMPLGKTLVQAEVVSREVTRRARY